jgi:hypothetical protein
MVFSLASCLAAGDDCPYDQMITTCNDQPCAGSQALTLKHKKHDEKAQQIIKQDFTQQKAELAEEMRNQQREVEDQNDPNSLFKAQQSAEDAQKMLEEMGSESNSQKDLEANERQIDGAIENNEGSPPENRVSSGCHNPEWHCRTCSQDAGDGNDCLSCASGYEAQKQWADEEHQYYSCRGAPQVASQRSLRKGNYHHKSHSEREAEELRGEEGRRNEWVSGGSV